MVCRFSLMKAYVLSAEELADEGAALEGYGLDEITIMDSAGTMTPDQVSEYVKTMRNSVTIPVAFHSIQYCFGRATCINAERPAPIIKNFPTS